MKPEDVVNLDAYPINDPESPKRADLIARAKAYLDAHQYVALDDFVRPEALAESIRNALEALPNAHHNSSRRNCYLYRTGDESLPEDHPRNFMMEASSRMLAYDRFSDASPLKTLYHWEPVRQMVADIVGEDTLYDSADPCQPVNLLCYQPGDRSAWHFDSDNAFTMTLMLQAPESGGDFELVPDTRSDTDPNYDYVGRVVRGECPEKAVAVARKPGSLCIFRGCNSLHRVSPVEGNVMRIMAVFVYESEPGVVGDPAVNETIYGRLPA
jgi:hypothetical protein